MIWTYRVFRDNVGRYSVRQVFYERDGTIIGYGKEPAAAFDASLEDLMRLVDWFRDAFDLPVLSTEGVDARLAGLPAPATHPRGVNVPLEQVIAELEREAATAS